MNVMRRGPQLSEPMGLLDVSSPTFHRRGTTYPGGHLSTLLHVYAVSVFISHPWFNLYDSFCLVMATTQVFIY